MTLIEFKRIMSSENITDLSGEDCSVFCGLLVIRKYISTAGITGAKHDMVFSVSADDLVNAGITIEDATELRKLNWMIRHDVLASFV